MKSNEIIGLTVLICIVWNITNYNCKILGIRAPLPNISITLYLKPNAYYPIAKITVKDTEVNVVKVKGEDYISLTDMLYAKDRDFFITDLPRNRNTLEFIGIWEKVYNPNFNYGEFAIIRNQSGLNSFKISVKEFVARTNAVRQGASKPLHHTLFPVLIYILVP